MRQQRSKQAAYARAVELANVARAKDPADRRALFDFASVKLRLGSLLVDDGQADEAVERLEESAHIVGDLLAREPASDRYGYLAVVINRRLGDAFATLRRRGEAIDRLMKARDGATRLLAGSTGPNARQQFVMATAKLARLYAEARDPRASTFADRAGGVAGGGLMNPGMGAAMSMMSQAQAMGAMNGMSTVSGMPDMADPSAQKATQTVQDALSKAGKQVAEELKTPKRD